METKINQNSKGKSIAFILVFISGLFIMSCDKSETPTPASGTMNGTHERSVNSAPVINNEFAWMVIDINHLPGFGLIAPDYEVKMLSDRSVVFEGRHNTGTIGTKTFIIDDKTYNRVVMLFENANFLNLEAKVPDMIDAPEIFTTYAIKSHDMVRSHTLHDFNVIPEFLINLRTTAEKELGIPALVKMNDKGTASVME